MFLGIIIMCSATEPCELFFKGFDTLEACEASAEYVIPKLPSTHEIHDWCVDLGRLEQ